MAAQMDQSSNKDDLKTQFVTREGTYRLMTLSEYSRPSRVGYQSNQSHPQVRVSLVSLPSVESLSSHLVRQSTNSTMNSSDVSSASTFTGPILIGGGRVPIDAEGIVLPPNFINNAMANGGVPLHGAASSSHDGGTLSLQQQMQLLSSPTSPNTIGHLLPGGGGVQSLIRGGDRICFNFGKELYIYAYRGSKKSTDLSKPLDKKLYKGTNPSCHDFNEMLAMPEGAPLIVGFSTGQIQLVLPVKRDAGRLFNEERLIDRTKVTCLKWIPRSPNLFIASHSSGYLYLYNEELPCVPAAPNYMHHKTGEGYVAHTCKSKQPRNPVCRWTFTNSSTGTGTGSLNEMAFSPCGTMLAIVSQDGFLRVFNYEPMELLGVARSYFGGFLCVCWSPDGKYIVVGGEDDLVTVWSLNERRVVARGVGHRSWVSVVAFDPYTSYSQWDGPDFSDDENPANDGVGTYNRCYASGHEDNSQQAQMRDDCGDRFRPVRPMSSSSTIPEKIGTSYRLGSVSQDTQLCLWDITEDTLRQSHEIRHRLSSHDPSTVLTNGGDSASIKGNASDGVDSSTNRLSDSHKGNDSSANKNLSTKITSSNKGDKSLDLSGGGGGKSANKSSESTSSTGITALTSLTQRLTNFSFGGENKKSSSDSHKKSFQFSKSLSTPNTGNHVHHSNMSSSGPATASTSTSAPSSAGTNSTSQSPLVFLPHNNTKDLPPHESSAARNSSLLSKVSPPTSIQSPTTTATTTTTSCSGRTGSSIVPSYDPMQLIGTPICPRYDECPLLEPLVCKKIAHERLTALIFREDCFLTACQDGFIYTWSRPGMSVSSNGGLIQEDVYSGLTMPGRCTQMIPRHSRFSIDGCEEEPSSNILSQRQAPKLLATTQQQNNNSTKWYSAYIITSQCRDSPERTPTEQQRLRYILYDNALCSFLILREFSS